ncbi:MAG: ADP-dependent glucokinase/phosphofructokinase [Candidatus Bathyarchaeota archaeon]
MPLKKVAAGLYANWDSKVKVDDKIVDWTKSVATKPKGAFLTSIAETAYTLKESFRKGGEEFLISKRIYSTLDDMFKHRKRELGGNGLNMGKTLHELGFKPLVSYSSRPSRLMLASPRLKVACGKTVKTPREAVRSGDQEYDHIVFEFKENQKKGILTSGRHILSWDVMSSTGIFDYDFLEYASNPKLIDVLLISYAHLLLPRYKKKTDEIIERLNRPRRPKVHLELGRGSEESVRYALKMFADYNCSDSWGMNEDECIMYLGAKSKNVEDIIDATTRGIRKYNLDRICVHSPDFVFSVSKYSFQKELNSLSRGCIVSAALTLGGISRNLKNARFLLKSKVTPVKRKVGKYHLCLIPTYINPKPKTLTGLGDAFCSNPSRYSF